MNMEDIFVMNYDGRISVDVTALIVAAWNTQEGVEKIFSNNKDYFEVIFDNPYDAAWAASIGDWCCTDRFVYFDDEGRLSSFSFWDDKNSPIKIDKFNISSLINELKELKNKKGIEKTGGNENNSISRAIQDALQKM